MTPTLSTEAAKLLALNEKRTPGEWVVGEEEDRQNYLPIHAKKHGAFAEVVVQMADDEKPFAEGIANAAFIAAAPRMAACIRSLLAALREAESPKWLPIETAPKDGTEILIAWDQVVVPAYYCGLPGEDCWYEYGKGPADGKDEFGIASPTHWMPYPRHL